MLESLWLPVVLTAVALFFCSFLSWMVLHLHKSDWRKLPNEDEVMTTAAKWNLPVGSYMFPYACENKEMQSEAFQKKYKDGPRGILQIMPAANMGAKLGFTILYFLVVAFALAYLSSVAFQAGETFLNVFRFIFTAALLIFLAATVQHSIWFNTRVTGHVIESLLYAAVAGAIFAGLWPGK